MQRPQVQFPPYSLAGFALGSPEFKSLTILVHNQVVYPRPDGILNPIKFDLNYCFQAFSRPH